MAHLFTDAFAAFGEATSIAVATTQSIPAGALVVISTATTTVAGRVNGLSGISGGGIAFSRDSHGSRASTLDVNLWSGIAPATIPSGTTFTATLESSSSRRTISISVHTGLGAMVASTNSAAPTTGDDNAGPNGSGTALSGSTTPTAPGHTIMAFGMPGGRTVTSTSNILAQVSTTNGSSDRGHALVESSSQSISATMNSSAGWTAAGATYAVVSEPEPEEPESTQYVLVGGTKKEIASEYVIVGGQKKAVVGKWVISGGVKKSIL